MRFAPIIRVSGERQEKHGESLNTQRKQITKDVEDMGGTIPEDCWSYVGQEHSSEGFERQLMDRLLEDSAKDIFDAVVMADISRLGRDDLYNQQAVRTLKDNGIQFYVGREEKDLFNPDHRFEITMFSAIHAHAAMLTARKACQNRIELIKQRKPVNIIPVGRTYDKESNTWGLKDGAKAKYERIARLMLEQDKSLSEVARLEGLNC